MTLFRCFGEKLTEVKTKCYPFFEYYFSYIDLPYPEISHSVTLHATFTGTVGLFSRFLAVVQIILAVLIVW